LLKAAVNAEDAEVNEKNTPKNVPKVEFNAEDETKGTSKTINASDLKCLKLYRTI